MSFMYCSEFILTPGHVMAENISDVITETNNMINPGMKIFYIHHRIVPISLSCIATICDQLHRQTNHSPYCICEAIAVESMNKIIFPFPNKLSQKPDKRQMRFFHRMLFDHHYPK